MTLATDDEIYAIEYATCGAQTAPERDALARQAVRLNRDTRAGAMAGDRRRGTKQPDSHPWKDAGRAMHEEWRANARKALP